ncbi:uncharacterized protein Saysd1 [Epargyreus clarus]|uniref:uncharacterized protein Saysd1 n=1 Tax=Epargyreus clarus TaxID=520877 RepID=UPI003C2F9F4A
MEAKLKEYRARRRREEFVEKTTEKFENTKRRFIDFYKKMIKIDVDHVHVTPVFTEVPAQQLPKKKHFLDAEDDRDHGKDREEQRLIEMNSETNDIEPEEEIPQESWKHFIVKWSIYTVIWVTLYLYFISLQFGAVFFAISLLVGIYLNTGTRPKKRGEVSAYSVFNENCESIDGTLTPEKLQREMFFGSFRLF